MRPYLIPFLIIALFSCKKNNEELPNTPKKISVDKSKVYFDYYSHVDTITVDAKGEWEVYVIQPNLGSFSVSKLNSFPNKFTVFASEPVTDGKDRTATIIVRPVNTTDTAAVYISAIRMGIARDTMVYGGTRNDKFNGIWIPNQNTRIAVGYSQSSDKDLSDNSGGKDCWVVKLDSKGQKLWSKSFGGSQDDVATSVVAMYGQGNSDGYTDKFLVGGYTYSSDGGITGNHGLKDALLILMDTLGNIIWKKTLGTAGNDEIVSMSNGISDGVLVTGIKDGDQWLIKLDADGNVEWEKSFGSSGLDLAGSFVEALDGYYFTGSGKIQDGDVSDKPTSSYDAWFVKMSKEGEIMWVKYIAGASDEKGLFITKSYNGNIFAIGTTESSDIFPEFNGTRNIFIASYDMQGNLIFKKIVRHTSWDEPMALSATISGNFIIVGSSQSSVSSTVDENSLDASILIVNPSGDVVHSRMFGGPGPDGITAISAEKYTKPFVGYLSGGPANTDINGNFSWLEAK